LHFRFDLFKPAHDGYRWTLMQLGFGADRVSLDAAVVEIPDPAGQAEGPGFLRHEVTKADALDEAGDQPAAGRLPGVRRLALQWMCSEGMPLAMEGGAVSRAFLTAPHKSCS